MAVTRSVPDSVHHVASTLLFGADCFRTSPSPSSVRLHKEHSFTVFIIPALPGTATSSSLFLAATTATLSQLPPSTASLGLAVEEHVPVAAQHVSHSIFGIMQSSLQGITHNLPAFLRDPAIAILGQECYTTLIYNVDFTSKYCLRLGLSKGLGLGIVVFGSIMKIPQILKIINSGSAKGISLTMYALEVVAYTISLAYAVRRKIPFSTYGENASLTVQNMIITLLIIAYSPLRGSLPAVRGSSIRASSKALPLGIAAVSMALGTLALFSESIVPPHLLSFLQATTIPVSLISKVPQMAELHRTKAPGQLSAVVVFAQLLGTIARVFTTLTETDDNLLFWGFSLATIFNLIIAIQLIMYWDGNDPVKRRTPGGYRNGSATGWEQPPAILSFRRDSEVARKFD